MKKELQEKLYKKYPSLFAQRKLKMSETCMCWGICTGDGWYKLIDKCCSSIVTYCKKKGIEYPEFTQVKEKFGTLRIYTNGVDNTIDSIISLAERVSAKTCECCGKPGKMSKGNWKEVLCGNCRQEKMELDQTTIKELKDAGED
jgi:hypothetical protein